jgi:hypothetical protein
MASFLRIDEANQIINLDHVISAEWKEHFIAPSRTQRSLWIFLTEGRMTSLYEGDQAHQVWSHLHRTATNPLSGRPATLTAPAIGDPASLAGRLVYLGSRFEDLVQRVLHDETQLEQLQADVERLKHPGPDPRD